MAQPRPPRQISFGDVVIGAILVIFFLQILALIVGIWVPSLRAVRLGQGVLLLAVLITAFFAVAIVRKKFRGGAIDRADVLMFILLIVLTIMAIFFLPRLIPDIFAREEFAGTVGRMLQIT